MPRRISSSLTLLYKVVFPVAWLGGFTAASIARAMSRPPNFPWFIFPAMTVFGAGLLAFLAAPLKRVDLTPTSLRISNFLREIEVPLESVASVTAWRLVNPPQVRIVFHQPTAFGPSIRFVPELRFAFFSEPPIAGELRDLAGLNEK